MDRGRPAPLDGALGEPKQRMLDRILRMARVVHSAISALCSSKSDGSCIVASISVSRDCASLGAILLMLVASDCDSVCSLALLTEDRFEGRPKPNQVGDCL